MNVPANKVEALFHEASELSTPEAREEFLRQQCSGDQGLYREVKALLNAIDSGQRLFQAFESDTPGAGGDVAGGLAEQAGRLIGGYKLLQKIGEGGMGVVYMAEQAQPVRRKVALKIIKLGMDTRQVVARFEAERQALALMDHPHIARVLDAGATETGRPYFVMDLVEGIPITEYCNVQQLSVEERVRLFIPVCQAIQSAHQKGIIHRDIKPSNVLVTMHNGAPHPLVIDFGVAKAIDQKLTEKTLFTNFATMIGTPAYMSPEQAEMSKLDVDTRSDIYSLGVLLYELLTGTTPFPEERLRSMGYGEMQRIITEEEPERPSTRLRTKSTVGAAIQHLESDIDSDLDWIVMKCLEKDRNRRYETVNGLAADLKRYLENETVVARPPTMLYRAGKFVRRNRTASTAVALVALVVLLGMIVSTWALLRERAARAQSEQRLKAALQFVDEVFTNVAPDFVELTGATSAQNKLAQAGLGFLQRLRGSAREDPELRLAFARVLLRVARAQSTGTANAAGDYEAGLRWAEEAIALLDAGVLKVSETEQVELLWWARFDQVLCLYSLGRVDEAIGHLEAMDALLDKLEQRPESARMARRNRQGIRNNAGSQTTLAGRPDEAIEKYLLPLLESEWARRITTNSEHYELETVMNANCNLASAYLFLKKFEAMRPYAEEAVRLGDVLVQRFPTMTRYPSKRANSLAHHGYALFRAGEIERGLTALNQSRADIENLVSKDQINDFFHEQRTVTTTIQSMAYAAWSEATTADIPERRRRLAQAEKLLTEAEQFFRATKTRAPAHYLKAARADVIAARAKL